MLVAGRHVGNWSPILDRNAWADSRDCTANSMHPFTLMLAELAVTTMVALAIYSVVRRSCLR